MPTLKACPPLKTLSAFLLGKLDDSAQESIVRHVESCDRCYSRLDRANEMSDSLIQGLRQPVVDDEFLSEPECRLAVERTQKAVLGAASGVDVLRDYELLEKLGQGGMGTVYRALHKKLDRWVAVKLLPTDLLQSAEAVSRFEREMRAIGRLHHPNIVEAHDAGEVDGQHYLVMELVEGMDLATLTRRRRRLSIADACEVVRQVALGLQHAHENELVHRDIKPSNIMLTAAGGVKILDLGLARLEEPLAHDDVTSTGQIMGTLDYMAPEQLGDSHAVDQRADIYSLGATLYKLLTGQAPYADARYNTPQKKLMAIATKPVESAVELRADIPAGLATTLDRMLAKNPDERFPAAVDIVASLVEFTANADLPTLYAKATHRSARSAVGIATKPKRSRKSTMDHRAAHLIDTDPVRPTTRPRRRTSARPKAPSKNPWQNRTTIAVIGLCLLFVAVMFTVFYVLTGKATLVVEVDDKDVEVKLREYGVVVLDEKSGREYTIIRQPGETKLAAGDYQLNVSDDAGLKVTTDEFTLTRRGRQIVRITLKPESPPPVQWRTLFDGETLKNWRPTPFGGQGQIMIEDGALVIDMGSPRTGVTWAGEPLPKVNYEVELEARRIAGSDIFCGLAFPINESHAGLVLGGGGGSVIGIGYINGRNFFDNETTDSFHFDKYRWYKIRLQVTETNLRAWIDNKRIVNFEHAKREMSVGIENEPLKPFGIGTLQTQGAVRNLRLRTITSSPARDGITNVEPSPNPSPAPSPSPPLPPPKDYSNVALILRKTLIGHQGRVFKFVFSKDGKTLISPGEDGTIRFWDVARGKEINRIDAHAAQIVGIALSPSEGFLASASHDHTVKLWSLSDLQPAHSKRIRTLAGHTGRARGVAFSPDGTNLASASNDGTIILWNVAQGTQKRVLSGHTGWVSWVAFSPDGKSIVSSSADTTIRVWDAMSGESKAIIRTDRALRFFTFSPDGRILAAVGADSTIRLWDWDIARGTKSGPLFEARLPGHSGWVRDVAFSPDGQILASTSDDKTIRLWDVNSRQQLVEQTNDTRIRGTLALAFSPDGKTVATANWAEGEIKLWDVRTEPLPPIAVAPFDASVSPVLLDETYHVKQFGNHMNFVEGLAFLPDGRRVISGHQVLRLWDLETGNEIRQFHGHTSLIRHLVLSHDGRKAITASSDETVRVWDIETGQELSRYEGHAGHVVWTAAVSPDDRFVLSAGGGSTHLWDLETAKEIRRFEGHNGAYSPNGRLVVTEGMDATHLVLWDIDTGQQLRRFEGHTEYMNHTFSPDGRFLLSGSANGTVILWSVDTGAVIHRFEGHKGWVFNVAFSPDGRFALSGSDDKTIRVWDVKTGKESYRFQAETNCTNEIAVSPNGQFIVSGGGIYHDHGRWVFGNLDNTLHLWRMPKNTWPAETEKRTSLPIHQRLVALNSGRDDNAFPWVSPDGLTICWTRELGGVNSSQTWTANRDSVVSPFQNATKLLDARHATFTSDGLYVVCLANDGYGSRKQLSFGSRASSFDAFSPLRIIGELSDLNSKDMSPAISADGLRLVFQRNHDQDSRFLLTTRRSRNEPWEPPQPVAMKPSPLLKDLLTWPFLSEDGLVLWFCNGGTATDSTLVCATRSSQDQPFSSYHVLELDGEPIIGRAPRYVSATRELFYSAPTGNEMRLQHVPHQNFELWRAHPVEIPNSNPSAQGFPDDRPAVFGSPGEAEDFELQGEYKGRVPLQGVEQDVGVQIVAGGDGRFDIVTYSGGLPGERWDGEVRIRTEGKRSGGQLVFSSGRVGELQDGAILVRNAERQSIGRLKKVHRKSPTLGMRPPLGAVVLFDGSSADAFENGRMTDDGLLMEGATSHDTFQDFHLHLEFRTPFSPTVRGQNRGNSGVFMQGRYEVQILDSFGLVGDRYECGAIFDVMPPDVNMAYPPYTWQTYDVEFTAAQYDETGHKTSNARMTVRHNGVLIHDDVSIPDAIGHQSEGPEPGPLHLQAWTPVRFRNIWIGRSHQNHPVCFRNIWIVRRAADAPEQSKWASETWTSLFDGESLDGWQRHSGTAKYTVEEGAIVGTSVPNTGNSFLCTTREYGDFIFECEFKVDHGLNSGVQFRSQFFDEGTEIDLGNGQKHHIPADRVHGYQCEIDCGDNPSRMWTAGVYDEFRRGWLYPGPKGGDGEAFSAHGVRIVNPEGWNTFRIECRGPSIKTYVNGELRADFEDDMTEKGVIGLQVHGIGDNADRVGKQVRWRNLRIQNLSAETLIRPLVK